MSKISDIFYIQKDYFNTNTTKDANFRIKKLIQLKYLIKNNEDAIIRALYKDLRKSPFESYATELGIIYSEINIHIKKLKNWSKPIKKRTSLVHFKSTSFILKEPYGVVLIIGPFNYPFHLVISPLIGAVSAGNTVMIKPSESTVNISKLLEKLINETFNSNYIRVIDPLGGKETINELLELNFDYIFFTGSPKVGKIIMKKAADNLIPLTLELGGKSPCIIDKSAKIDLACRRIVWGKFLNSGQTCIAPDYILVDKNVKDKLLEGLKKEILKQFSTNPKNSPDYPRIVNKTSLKRLQSYLDDGDVYWGGKVDEEDLYMDPTILINIKENSPITTDEIFGPILPIFEYSSLDEVLNKLNNSLKPLALYYFSKNNENIRKVLNSTISGGVTINDTILHAASSSLPFGGVGHSGIGAYHGKYSFDTFTHEKPVVNRSTLFELPFRFAPYKNKLSIIKKIMK